MTVTDLIGSQEACKILGIDRATLSRWVTTGKVTPYFSLPGATGGRVFHRRDIEALRDKERAS